MNKYTIKAARKGKPAKELIYNERQLMDVFKAYKTNRKADTFTKKEVLKSGVNAGFQNNFASPATGIRPLIPNYEKLDAGIYGIASVSLSDGLSLDGGLRYDFSKVDAKKFYFKSRWTERGYDVLFPQFEVREVGDQILAHPTFTFHNLSASLGFRKTFDKQWDWYTNISLATRNPNPSELNP